MYKRNITSRLVDALRDAPVVLLHGARQTGKTTLVQQIAAHAHPAEYVTLDAGGVLSAAQRDPQGFVDEFKGPVIIDEVQRVPELALAIKLAVDRDRRPGRFLLTGSANVLWLPRLADSLAGRMAVLTLWPLSQGEIDGVEERFIDIVFEADRLPALRSPVGRDEVLERLLAGGFPDAVARSPSRRRDWFESHVSAVLQRDVRDVMQRIERLHELPRVLSVLAARTATTLNVADLSRTLGIPHSTLTRYFSLLQTMFLLLLVPAWGANVPRRLARAPKLSVADSGFAAHLVGVHGRGLLEAPEIWGALLETFVIGELTKQNGWSRIRPQMLHFRTGKGEFEVDIVLEDGSGRVAGIEIKAASSVTAHDFRGLRALAEVAGKKFIRGIALYLGREVVPFGSGMYALPLSGLWRLGAEDRGVVRERRTAYRARARSRR